MKLEYIQIKKNGKQIMEKNKMLNDINLYIKDNCICDGLGPVDGHFDIGNFNELDEKDLENIIKIIEYNKKSEKRQSEINK